MHRFIFVLSTLAAHLTTSRDFDQLLCLLVLLVLFGFVCFSSFRLDASPLVCLTCDRRVRRHGTDALRDCQAILITDKGSVVSLSRRESPTKPRDAAQISYVRVFSRFKRKSLFCFRFRSRVVVLEERFVIICREGFVLSTYLGKYAPPCNGILCERGGLRHFRTL